jgi:hypothetical protein
MGEHHMTAVSCEAGPAIFSDDRKYRYTLQRHWQDGDGCVNFVMLNPSTADEKRLDPTLRRCLGYAQDWGYGRFVITNLFALRATDPRAMKAHPEPIGEDNDAHLIEQAQQADLVLCGWGAHGKHRQRNRAVLDLFKTHGIDLHYLVITAGGQPGHPLFLSSELRPVQWYRG